jgi:hypothetical protein
MMLSDGGTTMLIKKQYRPNLLRTLLPMAQVAFVVSILLERSGNPAFDFLSGMLMGFAVAGNLGYLINYRREQK